MNFTIAIDGPAAAGKGTIARALAETLGLGYLDTGLLYRATAARVAEGMDPVAAATGLTEMDLKRDGLRTPLIAQEASRVSAIPEVREALTEFQKTFAARDGGAILDGRDIGRTICPDADLKIFLTASTEARAKRRHSELAASGSLDSFESVLDEMKIRDARDAGRAVSPMAPADDAIIIDTSDITAGEAIMIALEYADRAAAA